MTNINYIIYPQKGKRNNNKHEEETSDEANNGDEIKKDSKNYNKNNQFKGYQLKDAYELFVILDDDQDGDPDAFDTVRYYDV